jgi:TonB-dependent starch-binding outer membrane protein SusC
MQWNWQNTLNYQTVIADDHSLNFTVGTEYQYTNFYWFSGSGNNISDDFFRQRNLISGSYNNQFSGGGFSESDSILTLQDSTIASEVSTCSHLQ